MILSVVTQSFRADESGLRRELSRTAEALSYMFARGSTTHN